MTATTVEARFDDSGRITVLSFTWQGRKRPVISHGRQWQAADGRHLLVMTPGERVFELVYAAGSWRVARGPRGREAA